MQCIKEWFACLLWRSRGTCKVGVQSEDGSRPRVVPSLEIGEIWVAHMRCAFVEIENIGGWNHLGGGPYLPI